MPTDGSGGAELRSITSLNFPTPVTRSGPGPNNAIKPDLVDSGGTVLFDGMTQKILTGDHYASAGMLTLRPTYLEGLLTSSTGTSMAALRIAYKAALLLRAMPAASANMIRALLALSADAPADALRCLQAFDPDKQRGGSQELSSRKDVGGGIWRTTMMHNPIAISLRHLSSRAFSNIAQRHFRGNSTMQRLCMPSEMRGESR